MVRCPYLQSLLIILDVVAVDIVVGPDGFPQLATNHHSRAFGGRATREEHDTTPGVLERGLKKANSDTESDSSAPQVSTIIGNRPGILLKLLERLRQLELTLLDRKQKSRGGAHGHRPTRLGLHARAQNRLGQAKHLLYLLRAVFLAPAKYIGFGALGIPNLVNLSLRAELAALAARHGQWDALRTVVPKVIRPANAFSGRRLRLITKDSFRAARLSSSWQVSTT